jgi:hypothetical protein
MENKSIFLIRYMPIHENKNYNKKKKSVKSEQSVFTLITNIPLISKYIELHIVEISNLMILEKHRYQ